MSNGIVANSAFNAAAGLTLLATGFICSIFTARFLGPEANGIIAFSIWLASTAALVAELGTGVLLLRLLPQLKGQGYGESDRKGFAAYLLWPVFGSTLLLLTFYFLFFWVAEARHWAETAPEVLVVTALLFATQAIGMFAKNYLIGEQRVDIFFRMTLTAGLLQLVGVVAGTLLFGVPGALFGYVLAYISQFLFAAALLRHKVKSCGIGLQYLLGSSFVLSLEFMVDSIFLNRIELFFLQRYQGIETVGYYSVAFSLTNLALQVPIQLSGSLVPYYAEHLHRAPGGRLPVAMFESVVRSLAYFTLPMSLGLAAISHRLVTLVFGDAFAPSAPMLTLLALSVPVAVACQVATQYLFALDKIRQRLFVGLGGAFIMLVGDVLLVPSYGGEGAAFVRIVVFTAMSLAMLRWMRFEGSLAPLGFSLFKVTVAAGCCAAAALAVQDVVPGIGGLVLAIIGAISVYCLALRLLRVVPEADVVVMAGLIARLPKRLAGPLNLALMVLTATPKRS
ncbi:oligosaccharide flippase family protein [Agrobacterium vitis]|uniref:Oligosaccharide flippase family protein n=1 Tax=Agrobacterium vitis TaxID=373 RepID=A0A6L6VFQ4_AGRVI|nr:polysaccharide biosynthesis C-terminal domain-containing protein [Agrobacterium vitis]MUZ74613.1 oligosaccharide flippase family protein [Agrobacterium vitis]